MRLLPRILKCLFVAGLAIASISVYSEYNPVQPIQPMTPQRRASHRITLTRNGRKLGYCTATAIGPHALLTASHCNADSKTDTVRLDILLKDYHIEKTLSDGRDHDIYLIDGDPLTNFIPYKVRPAKLGEHTFFYGCEGGTYPCVRRDGVRISFDDPSDVDADAGVVQFSSEAIPGDSGSAVFNDDGTIAAVTTYRWTEPGRFEYEIFDIHTGVDFLPGFTADQIKEATEFTPTPYTAPVKAKSDDEDANPFSFFLR
jgi:hypothetical protein